MPGMIEWQLIATAPRDGTWLLAARAGQKVAFVTTWDDDLGRWCTWNLWLEDQHQRLGRHDFVWEPTHWLPTPPIPPAA